MCVCVVTYILYMYIVRILVNINNSINYIHIECYRLYTSYLLLILIFLHLLLLLFLFLFLFLHRIDIINTNDNPFVSLDGEHPIIMTSTISYTEGSGPLTILSNLFVVDNDPSPIITRWDRNHHNIVLYSHKEIAIILHWY